jgi:hypothetical protein
MIGIIVFIMAVLFLSARMRKTSMNRQREGLTEDTFVNGLVTFGFDAAIARTTYKYLQQRQNVKFPIKATDQLDEDLGLDSADIEQSVRELLTLNERQHRPGMLHTPLVTVEDLVRFVQACPRKNNVFAA